MHPLLLPYSLTSVIMLVAAFGRGRYERSATWLLAWTAMIVVALSVAANDITGDLRRYHAAFLVIRDRPLVEVVTGSGTSTLFNLLNWAIGQITDHRRALLVVVGALSLGGLVIASRKLFSRYHTALLIFIYSMYPFYVQYIASGLKQAVAMSLMLIGLVELFHGRRRAWLWFLAAPLFHGGTVVILPFLVLHRLVWHARPTRRHALAIMLALLALTMALAAADLARPLMMPLVSEIGVPARYEIYFANAERFDYRAGFRPDFTLFSLLPVFSYAWLRVLRYPVSTTISGWWLSLYLSFCMIYQLFSFAPFADRFAGFAWYMMPLVGMVQCVESGSRRVVAQLTALFVLANILLLQFYTGARLR